MNNSNFGCDCTFAPISGELDEIFYLKKYQSPSDTSVSEFVSCELLEQEIESSFNNLIMKLKLEDTYNDAKKKSLATKRSKELDAINPMKNKIKKSERRSKMKDYNSRLSDFLNNPKTKIILEFDQCLACGIKSVAVNKNDVVKPITFFNGKMLMFAKLSLMSFIYELVEAFYFPNEKTKKIMKNVY